MVRTTGTFRSWDLSFVFNYSQIGTKPSPKSVTGGLRHAGAELTRSFGFTVHWSWNKPARSFTRWEIAKL